MRTARTPTSSRKCIIDRIAAPGSVLTSFPNSRSDPRVMTGLIASTTLRLINKGRASSGAGIFEATLLRLLETYRYDTFRHGKHRAILARSPARSIETEPREDLSAGVRNALLAAHKAMYPEKTREEFCVMMAESVKACFGGGVNPADLHAHKTRLRRFLTLVREKLTQ